MRVLMRRLRTLIIAIVLSVICVSVFFLKSYRREQTVYPQATKLFYAADYSHVWHDTTIKHIVSEALELYKQTRAQVVVVSVPDTQNDSLEKYSINIANKWQIGDRNLNNGILLLFTTGEPHVRLEVGKGLEGVINDGKAGRILDDYVVKYKDKRQWDKAALAGFNAVCRELYRYYNLPLPASLKFNAPMADFRHGGKALQEDLTFPVPEVIYNKQPLWLQWLLACLKFLGILVICAVIFRCLKSAAASRNMTVKMLIYCILFGSPYRSRYARNQGGLIGLVSAVLEGMGRSSGGGGFSGGGFSGGGGGFSGGGASR